MSVPASELSSIVLTQMTSQIFRLDLDVPAMVRVITSVAVLSQEIEAMQLMEDLNSSSVSLLARTRVIDGQRAWIKTETLKLLRSDHLIANIVGDVVPRLINIRSISGEFGLIQRRSDVVTRCLVLDRRYCRCCSKSDWFLGEVQVAYNMASIEMCSRDKRTCCTGCRTTGQTR